MYLYEYRPGLYLNLSYVTMVTTLNLSDWQIRIELSAKPFYIIMRYKTQEEAQAFLNSLQGAMNGTRVKAV